MRSILRMLAVGEPRVNLGPAHSWKVWRGPEAPGRHRRLPQPLRGGDSIRGLPVALGQWGGGGGSRPGPQKLGWGRREMARWSWEAAEGGPSVGSRDVKAQRRWGPRRPGAKEGQRLSQRQGKPGFSPRARRAAGKSGSLGATNRFQEGNAEPGRGAVPRPLAQNTEFGGIGQTMSPHVPSPGL